MSAKSGVVSLALVGLLAATGCSASSDNESDARDTAESLADATSSSPSESGGNSSKASPSAPAEGAGTAEITIVDFEFQGPDSVAPGAEITVTNEDSASHTVTTEDDGGFDVTVAGGETVTFTAPAEPGSYPYVCTFHADMTGTLVVK